MCAPTDGGCIFPISATEFYSAITRHVNLYKQSERYICRGSILACVYSFYHKYTTLGGSGGGDISRPPAPITHHVSLREMQKLAATITEKELADNYRSSGYNNKAARVRDTRTKIISPRLLKQKFTQVKSRS